MSWVTAATNIDQTLTIASVGKKNWTTLYDSEPNNMLRCRKGGGPFGLEDGDIAVRRNVGSPEISRLVPSDPSSLPSPSSKYQRL